MKLLSIDQIQKGLDMEFLPLEPMLEGFRLKPLSMEENALSECESLLCVKFPYDFRKLVSNYDFGNLTIGPIVFCATGDFLSELVEFNEEVSWWGNGARPANLIMIANSDPYSIILDVQCGEVSIVDPEIGLSSMGKVSVSFESFIRGVGSIFLLRNIMADKESLARFVARAVHSENLEFWSILAR